MQNSFVEYYQTKYYNLYFIVAFFGKTKSCGEISTAFVCAGTDLFSQGVATQVFSARVSLTSVFGMGTGGTSRSFAPAMVTRTRIELVFAA